MKVSKDLMPWEERPQGCTDVFVALFKEPSDWKISNSNIKQYL